VLEYCCSDSGTGNKRARKLCHFPEIFQSSLPVVQLIMLSRLIVFGFFMGSVKLMCLLVISLRINQMKFVANVYIKHYTVDMSN